MMFAASRLKKLKRGRKIHFYRYLIELQRAFDSVDLELLL